MEEIKEKKQEIRDRMAQQLLEIPEEELSDKNQKIENRLFEFANFLESKIVLLYLNGEMEVTSRNIIEKSFQLNKIVVLPNVNTEKTKRDLFKVDNLDTDALSRGADLIYSCGEKHTVANAALTALVDLLIE